jgi:pimeloyl-ACP methyl ester carboxylesterase
MAAGRSAPRRARPPDHRPRCDEQAASANQERFFTGGYRRAVLDGVGHFPHREAPDEVAGLVDEHLAALAETS